MSSAPPYTQDPNPKPRRRRAGGPEARARGAGGAGRGPGRRAAQEGARGLRRAAVDYCLQQARPHEAAARPPRPPTPPLPGPAASPAGAPDRHASPPFRVGTIAGGIRCSRGPPRRRGGRRQGAPPRQPPRGRRKGPPAARARAVTAAAARSAGTTTTWPPAAWTCTSPRAARTACTSAAWARPASCGPSSWTPARSSQRRRARPAGPGPARLQPAPLACVSAVCDRPVSCAPGLRRAWLRPGAQRAAGGARLRGACRCTARLPCSQRARAGRSQRGRARGAGALRGATPVPAQGLDHGAVGRRVLHHRHRRCAAPPAPAPRPQAALLGASPAGPARLPWRCDAPAWIRTCKASHAQKRAEAPLARGRARGAQAATRRAAWW